MTEVTLASLAMEVSVPTADAAIDKLTRLRKVASELEGQAGRTASATKEQASAHGYAGTAAAQAEKTMRGLVEVYGTAFNASGRYRHSVEAEVSMILQNAKATAALAREQDAAARAVQRLTSSYDPLGGEVLKVNRQLAEAEKLYQKGAISAAQYASVTDGLKAKIGNLEAAQASGVKSSRSLQYATLNLGRQFSDIGVTLASGMNPLMVLVQQGPQIGEVFATLKAEGIGAGAAFRSMGAALAPALPLIIGIGAAVGVVVGAFGLFERAVDKQTKNATTFGDTWKAVLKVTGDYIMDGPIGDGLKWLEKAFTKTLDFVTGVVAGGAVKIAGFFGASYLAIVNNWKRLPEVVGVILQNAANAAIKATEWLINKGIDGINALGKNFGFAQIGKVALGTFKSASTDIAKQFDADQKRIEAATEKGLKDFMGKVAAQADREFEKRQKATKAIKEHTKAIELQNETVAASNEVWPEALAIAAAYEAQQKALKTAANDNIKAFDALGVAIPTAMENAALEMDDAASKARELRFDIEDIASAIQNNDWASGFAGLLNVLAKVEVALGKNATQLEKVQALAGIGMGVGQLVGGTAGSAISGGASGALAGAAFAGSKLGTAILPGLGTIGGALLGGAVGLVGSLFGSSKAKKQAKAQAAAQKAAEEAQRQQTIADTLFQIEVDSLRARGQEGAAVAKERERALAELQALSPSLAEAKRAYYELADATEAANKAAEKAAEVAAARQGIQDRIDALTMSPADLLAKERAKERAGLEAVDPSLAALIDQLYALQDASAAAALAAKAEEDAKAAAALEAEAAARANDLWSKSVAETADMVAQAAQRQADAMRSLGDSFVNAMKSAEDAEKSLRSFADSLLSELGLGGGQGYAAARSAFLTSAQGGNFDQSLAQAFLDASKASSATTNAYRADVALVRGLALNTADDLAGYPARLAMLFRSIQADSMSGLPGFASGGSMVIGGNPGVDQNVLSLNGAPVARVGYGETLSVTPAGGSANDNSAVVAELRAMRQQIQDQAANIAKLESYTRNVTQGGQAMLTEAV